MQAKSCNAFPFEAHQGAPNMHRRRASFSVSLPAAGLHPAASPQPASHQPHRQRGPGSIAQQRGTAATSIYTVSSSPAHAAPHTGHRARAVGFAPQRRPPPRLMRVPPPFCSTYACARDRAPPHEGATPPPAAAPLSLASPPPSAASCEGPVLKRIVDRGLHWAVLEEVVEDDKLVLLRDVVGEAVVLAHEPDQLGRRPIVR